MKGLPAFKSDDQEARYWAVHSSAPYWDSLAEAREIVFEGEPKRSTRSAVGGSPAAPPGETCAGSQD